MRLPLCPISLPQLKMLLVKMVSLAPHHQRLGHRLHRGAAGQDDRCAVRHQAGGQPADGALAVDIVTWRTVISGSLCSSEIAPPWVLRRRWLSASATRSRRMVSRDTFSLRWISVIESEPRPVHHGKDQSLSFFGKHGRSYSSVGRFGFEADFISESPLGIFSTLLHLIAIML
jgi:hypothetical protein